MAHARKTGGEQENREDQSLIPAIREREQSLAALLEETRRRCEDEVRQAEGEAARRVADGGANAARAAAARREAEAARVEAETGDLARGLELEIREIEAVAARNLDRAAAMIVAAVWPEDRR